MSKWLDIEGENVRSRKAGIYWLADWKTNAPPDIGIKGRAIESVPRPEFHQTLRYSEPAYGAPYGSNGQPWRSCCGVSGICSPDIFGKRRIS
jgi:hypothetical protein